MGDAPDQAAGAVRNAAAPQGASEAYGAELSADEMSAVLAVAGLQCVPPADAAGATGFATSRSKSPAAQAYVPPALDGAGRAGGPLPTIELLNDVTLDVTVELGRTRMLVEDVLKLGSGSVVELDKLAGDPVDIYVNERLVARGEVLVLNDDFCVRISEIVTPREDAGV